MSAIEKAGGLGVGVELPRWGPFTNNGVCTGVALTGWPGSATPTRRPLTAKLLDTVARTPARSTQLAVGEKRSSVKANE